MIRVLVVEALSFLFARRGRAGRRAARVGTEANREIDCLDGARGLETKVELVDGNVARRGRSASSSPTFTLPFGAELLAESSPCFGTPKVMYALGV